MTTVTNEAFIGCLDENCYLMWDCRRCKGDFSGGASEYIFDCWLRFSPIIRISHKGLGDNMALFWEIILLETVLILYVRDLVPTSFFK